MAKKEDQEPVEEPAGFKNTKRIRYVGTSDVRVISTEDWDSAGIEGQPTVSWETLNDFRIEASLLSPEAVAYLEGDADFEGEGS